jgi:hypothetical protein
VRFTNFDNIFVLEGLLGFGLDNSINIYIIIKNDEEMMKK